MNRKEFSKSASTAIKEGKAARQALAEKHANRFVNGTSDFDPRTLSKLGDAGIRRFLSIVQDSGIEVEYPVTAVSNKDSPPAVESSAKGWSKMQRPEPSWKVRALIYGAAVGTAIFLCGLITINTLSI